MTPYKLIEDKAVNKDDVPLQIPELQPLEPLPPPQNLPRHFECDWDALARSASESIPVIPETDQDNGHTTPETEEDHHVPSVRTRSGRTIKPINRFADSAHFTLLAFISTVLPMESKIPIHKSLQDSPPSTCELSPIVLAAE